jgi:hydrocephalus-inducing protein
LPGKEQQVEIHFNREKTLNREVTLKGDTSISLAIIETLTGRKETATFVKVNLRAVFTKYTLSPPHGINFGPLMYNTTSNPRVFEIVNTGEFPFNVNVVPYGDDDAGETKPEEKAKGGKGDAAGKELKQGNFTITPSCATVEPGTTLKVEVTFEVVAQRTYVELLAIHITDRDPNDHPGGIPYEIAGESCIPGIVTEDFMSIFEEHKLVASLDPHDVENNVFAMRDRVFNFGAVIAHMGGEAAAAAAREAVAAASEADAAGGSIQAPPTKPVLPGVQANLKVTNCNKVPCTINLAMKERGASMPAGEVHPMDIQPKQLTLPPHEYRYVTVYFTPQRMQRYAASLDVVVQNGSDPRTKHFTCEIRGEGTLPHVMVEAPDALDDAGRPMLTFPRLLLGKTHTLPVTLRNNGIIAATARLEMGPSDAFSLASGLSSNVVLEPKRTHTFNVVFKPESTKAFAHELQLMIKHNSFETQSIALAGECYQEDVTFEGLPRELDDELHFEDGAVGTGAREIGFTLRNHTAKAFRFWWPRVSPHLTFSPRRGHLHGKSTMDILVSFNPEQAVALSPLEDLGLVIEEITYEGEHKEQPEWDDRMTTVKYVPLDHEEEPEAQDPPRPSAATAGGKGGKDSKVPPPAAAALAKPTAEVQVVEGEDGQQLKRIEVVEPEPAHKAVEGTSREIGLKVRRTAARVFMGRWVCVRMVLSGASAKESSSGVRLSATSDRDHLCPCRLKSPKTR